jgi:imidazoleglycerol-phosphate dehydratase/histidinol-phosphatase
MKKVLFIFSQGAIVRNNENSGSADVLSTLNFVPGVFRWLSLLAEKLDYELIMIDNYGQQEKRADRDVVRDKIISWFRDEGILFSQNILVTHEPNNEGFRKFATPDYDMKASFVIGSSAEDMSLAERLDTGGIVLNENLSDKEREAIQECGNTVSFCASWKEVYARLLAGQRSAVVERNTKETKVNIELLIDGKGKSTINTGLPFFDHMLEQLARHSGMDLSVAVEGDLHVDEHHTIEDTALALGEAVEKALGSKRGIERYGFALPMDDCNARVLIDFGGRPWLVWEADFKREKIGEMPTEMFMHFFKSFSDTAKCNLQVKAEGKNEHHKIEAVFKAWAKAVKMAIRRDVFSDALPTTKGTF